MMILCRFYFLSVSLFLCLSISFSVCLSFLFSSLIILRLNNEPLHIVFHLDIFLCLSLSFSDFLSLYFSVCLSLSFFFFLSLSFFFCLNLSFPSLIIFRSNLGMLNNEPLHIVFPPCISPSLSQSLFLCFSFSFVLLLFQT